MDDFMSAQNMQSLVDLCDPESAAQREWEQGRATGQRVTGFSSSVAGHEPAAAPEGSMVDPAGVGPKMTDTARANPKFSKQKKKIAIAEGDIWDDEEVDDNMLAAYEGRERPEYEMLHKQAVTSNDVYLGLDFEKDATSASCEEMTVRVELPKEHSAADIHLDVKQDMLDLRSPHYRLLLPLQKKVLTNRGSARFEKDKKRMVITLVVDRSFEAPTKLI
eukprot:TRINITY_DN2150_c0_g1_i1.p2 TRINITY_DN2150_c0_g1~~TRINITY_DN2150_c0_g1_i1.p2  ORF type:complete len:219 (+),score=98.67 TRINITY_DN2150_c0_g1_i1:1283-1939(+)